MMFMYFWLSYCNKNHHNERIPIAVQKMDHLFHLASEIIEADMIGFICFCFLTVLELMKTNT